MINKANHILFLSLLFLVACSTDVPKSISSAPPRAAEEAKMADRIQATIRTLVGMQNRNSCGAETNSGVAKAADWIASQYAANVGVKVVLETAPISKCNHPGSPVIQKNVIAILPGDTKPNEVIVLGGHYDDRTFDVIDTKNFAPGANDSGSQTALLIEVVRELAKSKRHRTVVVASFVGEEQAGDGSTALARDYKKILPGATVLKMLCFDIVGGDSSVNDDTTLNQFRLFAPPDTVHMKLAEEIIDIAKRKDSGFQPILIKSRDRPGRASDHFMFQDQGIPAVRLMETRENLAHQHSDQDLPKYVTPIYTAHMATLVTHVAQEMADRP